MGLYGPIGSNRVHVDVERQAKRVEDRTQPQQYGSQCAAHNVVVVVIVVVIIVVVVLFLGMRSGLFLGVVVLGGFRPRPEKGA